VPALFVGVIALTSLGTTIAPDGVDSLGHAGVYGALAGALLWASGGLSAAGLARRAVAITLAVVALGALMEWAQGIVHRDENVNDLVMDGVGAGLVAAGIWIWSISARRGAPQLPR
jgi:VanZ family protein